jgi:cell division protein FtsB
MKLLTISILSLIALLQYPLWFGKANWPKVWEMGQEVKTEHRINSKLQDRNNRLEAEVNDLKQGFDAIEERARSELGMINQDEIFFQILKKSEKETSQRDSLR